MLKKLFTQVGKQRAEERRAELYRNLIRHEARVGGELFGPIPKNVRREFFCLDENTWVWHEEWIDEMGKRQIKTTRYDVRPSGVLKSQAGQPSSYVTLEEGRNLYRAVGMYNQRVDAEFANFL